MMAAVTAHAVGFGGNEEDAATVQGLPLLLPLQKLTVVEHHFLEDYQAFKLCSEFT